MADPCDCTARAELDQLKGRIAHTVTLTEHFEAVDPLRARVAELEQAISRALDGLAPFIGEPGPAEASRILTDAITGEAEHG